VVIVPPWNFPYAIPTGGICAALAAGNSVIFKSAPETVATSWQLVNQLWRAGVPKEVLQFVSTEDNEIGKSLITHEDVNAVILTGAYSTAELFSSWKNELNLLAETSGKNSMVLTACCDIDVAVKDLVQSAFGHAGQKCSAASLAIVEKSIYENPNFKKQLIDAVQSLRVGPGYVFSTTVGPIIKKPEQQLERALTALDDGEEWLIKPNQIDEAGLMWSAGVKTGVKPGSWSHLNEWFGPVLAIMVAPDLETAIEWQNATDFGLTAGIQSLDPKEEAASKWLKSNIALAIDRSGLEVEQNVQRYRRYKKGFLVRIESGTSKDELDFLNWIKKDLGVITRLSSDTLIPGLANLVVESTVEFAEHAIEFDRVRWLSAEVPPVSDLMINGVACDRRPIATRGDVEISRWFLEQSVSITQHRYGNTNAGPKPACVGLVI